MIEKTFKLYTMSELKEQFPKGFQRAFENHYTQTWDFWSDIKNDMEYYLTDALYSIIGTNWEKLLYTYSIKNHSYEPSGVDFIELELDFYNDYYLDLARKKGLSEESYQLLDKVLNVASINIDYYKHGNKNGEHFEVGFEYQNDYIMELLQDEYDHDYIEIYEESDIDKLEKEMSEILVPILNNIYNDLESSLNDNIEWRNSEERTIEASEANDELYFEDGKEVE